MKASEIAKELCQRSKNDSNLPNDWNYVVPLSFAEGLEETIRINNALMSQGAEKIEELQQQIKSKDDTIQNQRDTIDDLVKRLETYES